MTLVIHGDRKSSGMSEDTRGVNATSRVWWALIEEITPRAEEMAVEKEIACCVRGDVYKEIWAAAIREVWCVVWSRPTSEKYSL